MTHTTPSAYLKVTYKMIHSERQNRFTTLTIEKSLFK